MQARSACQNLSKNIQRQNVSNCNLAQVSKVWGYLHHLGIWPWAGCRTGPPKQGHSVLLGLTNSESNQCWKWKSSSYIQTWFSPARVKLFKLMEGFAALALAPVPEDHWQHSMPLFHSSQRTELEEKKLKGKIPTLWRHKIKSMLLIWSQLAFRILKCQSLPLQVKS